VSLLPFTECAYNNADHFTLGCSLFFANHQFNPCVDYCLPLFKGELLVPAASAWFKLFQSTMGAIHDNLQQAQEDAKRFADCHQCLVSFRVGNKVWILSTKKKL
jgi:hypothetical protein